MSAVGLVAATMACSANETTCVDLELLSTPARGLRKSQGYVDPSPHGPTRNCQGCHFFAVEGAAGCGRCEILGGPVSERGHCSAWSKRTNTASTGRESV
jgi:hypothetical protein